MNIKNEKYLLWYLHKYFNLYPESHSLEEILVFINRQKDLYVKSKLYEMIVNYYIEKDKIEDEEILSSVARDCIMTEYNRQKGIEL